jgi:hypothetical protein
VDLSDRIDSVDFQVEGRGARDGETKRLSLNEVMSVLGGMTDKAIVKERKSWIDTQTKDRVKMHESKERECGEVRNSTETRC